MDIREYHTELFECDPVKTEYEAYRLLRDGPLPGDVGYLAVPWAVLINRKGLGDLSIKPLKGGFTICQHTQYSKIIPVLLECGIDVLFAPHAAEDHKDIRILPFPHYAVNGPHPAGKKDIWYSFIGLDSTAQTAPGLRRNIFAMDHPENTVIIEREQWHWARENRWGDMSEDQQEEQRTEYRDTLARSRFSLCPRGFGPSTLRFWESLKAAAIPVLLSDTMRLPAGVDWDRCIVRLREDEADKIPDILSEIPAEREQSMRLTCLEVYSEFSGDNFVKCIRKYFDNTL